MAQVALDHIDDVVARVRHAMPSTHRASPAGTEQDSLQAALRAVRRSWWIILVCGAVAAAGAVVATRRKPIRYDAVTSMLVAENGYQQAIGGGYNPIDPQRLQATISALLTPAVLHRAASRAGLSPSDTYTVTTQPSSSSDVMGIRATTGHARTAAALANATADQLLLFRRRLDALQLRDARGVIQSQIATARSASDRHVLVGELNNLAALQALANQGIQIVQRASIPASASSRGTTRTAAIALVLGILFGVAFSLLRSRDPGTPR
jgi:uncharacterized protein involved in exopolysaccharide biosynthesis